MVAGISPPIDEPSTATPGEKFYVWPDPTGRLGAARLWPHLFGFLCQGPESHLPADWESHLPTFSEPTLLEGLAFPLPFFCDADAANTWETAMHRVRQELFSRDLVWSNAFALCSNNLKDATNMVGAWRASPRSVEALPLPAGDLGLLE